MLTIFGGVKLQAAAKSMHQFCQVVRSVFPGDVRDDVIEAATGFLYLSVCADVFGKRSADRVRRLMRSRLKYLSPSEFAQRTQRIGLQAEAFRISESSANGRLDDDAGYQLVVNSTIRALLIEAGLNQSDAELVRSCFAKFEHAAARIKAHLVGIRQQNRWLMAG